MPNDDAVGKGGWGGENVSKSDDVILVCSLTVDLESTLEDCRCVFPQTPYLPEIL